MVRGLLFVVLSLFVWAGAVPSTILAQRQVALAAVEQHLRLHPGHVCPGNGGEWHSEVVAFPRGRSDRVYPFSSGAASAYRVRRGQARLVWCAQAIEPPAIWNPASVILQAIAFPVRTTAGSLPREPGGLDVIRSSGGQLTTLRLDGRGRVLCQRASGGDWPRTAFQFDEREHCP